MNRYVRRIFDVMAEHTDIEAHLPTLYILGRIAPPGDIVELGVRDGCSTTSFLAAVSEREAGVLHSYDIDARCQAAALRTANLPPKDPLVAARWKFAKSDSVEAANGHKDESVGLVFVDTSHMYDDTYRELEAWEPKVAKGGIICGHDYLLDGKIPDTGKMAGVRDAVSAFRHPRRERWRIQTMCPDSGLFVLWTRGV